MTQQEEAVDNTRQVCGGQCNERMGQERETSGWQTMQCDWAANDTTRGGGRRTPCKAFGQWMTQNERQEQQCGAIGQGRSGQRQAIEQQSTQSEERDGGPNTATDNALRVGEQRTQCGGG
jgi:hypothetical protein